MGFFRGKAWTDQSGVEYAFAFVWGEATRDTTVDYSGSARATNTIRFYQHQKLNVSVYGESEAFTAMAAVEEGDMVACFGTWKLRRYTTRKGEQKEKADLTVDLVLPMPLVHFAQTLHDSDTIRRMLRHDRKTAVEDVMESFADPKEEDPYHDFGAERV